MSIADSPHLSPRRFWDNGFDGDPGGVAVFVDITMLITYVLGSLALIIKPGPDFMCLLATALSEGRVRALALMVGLIFGCWLWVLLLPFGVASFLAGRPAVMAAIQIVGVCYIGYLAVRSLQEAFVGFCGTAGRATEMSASVRTSSAPRLSFFRRGVVMAMSNPLTILFFLAFLPNSTRTGSSLSPAFQTFLLGTLFCALVPIVHLPVIFAAGAFRARLIGNARFAVGLKALSGILLLTVVDNIEPDGGDGSSQTMRLSALNRLERTNRLINDIDDALRRIEDGTYGVCQSCGSLIASLRLMHSPFVRTSTCCRG